MRKNKTMRKKKTLKAELKALKSKEFKQLCKKKVRSIAILYIWEECCKMYVYIAPLLMAYGLLSKVAAWVITPIAVIGSLSAFTAKLYHLKNTKFRKRGFYGGGK